MKSICYIKKVCGAFAVSAALVLCGCSSDVSGQVNAAGIEVSSVPRKMSYKKGETLDLTGLEVKMNMTDGSARTLSAEEYTVVPASGTKMNDEGAVPVKITSDGKTVYFVVYVGNAETAVGIEISSLPDKTNYKKGESLDLTGLAVKMNRTDGSSVVLDSQSYTAEPAAGTPLEEDGTVPVKITSGGKTVFFTVSVGKVELKRLLLTALPKKTYYLSDEKFETEGLSVKVQFDDGTEKELGYGEYHISILNGGDLEDGFGQKVTVSYGNLSAYFIINVSVSYDSVDIVDDGTHKIPASVYNEAKNLRTVTIPDTITEIGAQAFYNCAALKEITLPASVWKIERRAFYGCKSLTKIVIPDGCEIGESAFENCISVTELTFEGSWNNTWGGRAFAKLTNLVTLDLGTPLSLNDAFEGCTSLTSVTIPDGVTSINNAFQGCTSLTSITIPDGVTSIGGAFAGCTSLTSITIPNSVTDINGAFEGCTSLTSITIPNKVTSIGGAFKGCTSLESITIPNSVTEIGWSTFAGCTSLTSITIPDSVTSIWGSAFKGCTSLESITIPNSVVNMGDFTFQDCTSLTSITIPSSVTKIECFTFKGCTSLTEITYNGTKEDFKRIEVDNSSGLYGKTIRCTDDEFVYE